MMHYPINRRDENQLPLPHGVKAILIAVSSFLLMMAIMVGLLRLATAPTMTYTNIESEAGYEGGFFGLLSRTAVTPTPVKKNEKPILERLSSLKERLDTILDEQATGIPDIDLTVDF